MKLLLSQSLASKTVCTYKKISTTEQSTVLSCRSQTSQYSLVSSQFSYSCRDVDKSCAVFIKIVHNIWVDGVDCFSLYSWNISWCWFWSLDHPQVTAMKLLLLGYTLDHVEPLHSNFHKKAVFILPCTGTSYGLHH